MVTEKQQSPLNQFFEHYNEQYSEHTVYLPFAGKTVGIRALKVSDQKALIKGFESGKSFIINQVIDKLLSDIVTDWNGCDLDSMYLRDREQILLVAKAYSLSPEVTFEPQCPLCKTNGEAVTINIFEIEDKSPDQETLTTSISLYDGKYSIQVKIPTRAAEKECDEYVSRNKEYASGASIADEEILSLATILTSLTQNDTGNCSDSLPFGEKIRLVENLLAKDKAKMRDFLTSFAGYGFPSVIDFECSNKMCGYRGEVIVDLSDFLAR